MPDARVITSADAPELARRFRQALQGTNCAKDALQQLLEQTITEYCQSGDTLETAAPASHLMLTAWLLQKPADAAPDDSGAEEWPRRYAGWYLMDNPLTDRDEIQWLLNFVADTWDSPASQGREDNSIQ